jgi:hypothetical protein
MCVLRGMFLIEIQGFTFHYRGSSNPKLSQASCHLYQDQQFLLRNRVSAFLQSPNGEFLLDHLTGTLAQWIQIAHNNPSFYNNEMQVGIWKRHPDLIRVNVDDSSNF